MTSATQWRLVRFALLFTSRTAPSDVARATAKIAARRSWGSAGAMNRQIVARSNGSNRSSSVWIGRYIYAEELRRREPVSRSIEHGVGDIHADRRPNEPFDVARSTPGATREIEVPGERNPSAGNQRGSDGSLLERRDTCHELTRAELPLVCLH